MENLDQITCKQSNNAVTKQSTTLCQWYKAVDGEKQDLGGKYCQALRGKPNCGRVLAVVERAALACSSVWLHASAVITMNQIIQASFSTA